MRATGAAFSHLRRAGFAWRALAAGSAHADDGRSENNTGARVGPRCFARCSTPASAVFGLMLVAPSFSSHAQAPPLGTTADFAILAGAGITNTGPTVITGIPAHPGNIGSTIATITGFPPGLVNAPGVIETTGNVPTITAQNSLTTAFNNLAGKPPTANLTGQNPGGLTLIPGV